MPSLQQKVKKNKIKYRSPTPSIGDSVNPPANIFRATRKYFTSDEAQIIWTNQTLMKHFNPFFPLFFPLISMVDAVALYPLVSGHYATRSGRQRYDEGTPERSEALPRSWLLHTGLALLLGRVVHCQRTRLLHSFRLLGNYQLFVLVDFCFHNQLTRFCESFPSILGLSVSETNKNKNWFPHLSGFVDFFSQRSAKPQSWFHSAISIRCLSLSLSLSTLSLAFENILVSTDVCVNMCVFFFPLITVT